LFSIIYIYVVNQLLTNKKQAEFLTQHSVQKIRARQKGIKVVKRAIFPNELKDAVECFATGTAAEVTPIGKIDDMVYKVGPVTTLLRDEYLKLVRTPPLKQTA
jgi:branched-subunit amino acid aminotransferase/4-amino-4-deoxychorismate lyase